MNFQAIINLALSLLGKREELMGLVKEAMALFQKIKTSMPELVTQIEALTSGAPATNQYTVKWLQESLNKIVDAKLTVDGNYGDATKEAVKKFQAANGLTVDGWAGVQTTAAVINALK